MKSTGPKGGTTEGYQTGSKARKAGFLVHPQALCETTTVGDGTRVWAFAHILPGATIGSDCNICDGVFVENEVVVGDHVTVKCGVQLWDGVTLEDHVFVGPNATFANNPFPRSQVYPKENLRTLVCRHASIGANATILPGISIGRNAMVGAGSVVTRSVPDNAIVTGNPARVVGYVDAHDNTIKATSGPGSRGNDLAVEETTPDSVALHTLHIAESVLGNALIGGFASDIPFAPKAFQLLFDVPKQTSREPYAHRACHEFLICVRGSCKVLTDDGDNRREIPLQEPAHGLYVPAMTWCTQSEFSENAVLLVFASEQLDDDVRIRDYDQFLREAGPATR